MALPDLATAADLSTRGVDTSDATLVDTMLAVASSVVRSATQSPVAETTSTVAVWVTDADQYVRLPGLPVTAVSTVLVDGEAVTDFKLVHGRLWRLSWGFYHEPLELTVTLTHGFANVPEHITQIVCDVAIRGMAAAADGAHDPNVVAESIDDYSVTFAQGAESVATAMELPRRTRMWLRSQFGGGAAMVVAR